MILSTLRGLVFSIAVVGFATLTIAQKPNPNPEQQPRKVRPEPKKAYVDWLENVRLIMTDSEKDAWTKLKTDEEREQFIHIFWDTRDTNPDTEENEFKDQFYERTAYANEHFSSGRAGRLTDRGRIYIKFGKPDEIESHPAGGAYERPADEGGGSTSTYPFEKWFYRNLPNVGSGIEIEFVDPSGTGEYRIARNPNEKDALLYTGGGPTIAEMMGFETRADRITNGTGFGLANYVRAQDSPFEVMDRIARLEQVQPVERNSLSTGTHSPKVEENPLNFDYQLNFFRQTDNRVFVVLTLQTENNQLSFVDQGGLQTARMNIFGRLITVADRSAGKFEDTVVTTATVAELTSARNRKSAYAKTFILAPGRYRADLMVRDVTSGATGTQQVGFEVPTFSSEELSASSVVLAAKLEDIKDTAALGPFAIGTTKVVPNLGGTYRKGQPVGIYLQVYNAAIDQTTLRPAVDVEYVVLKEGKELQKQAEDWREINDAGQRLTLRRLIDTQQLIPGKYEIQVRIHDQITSQSIAKAVSFTIEQ
jgi:GWxTD domain-containing protein